MKLFWRIFLSFWLATALMIVFVLSVSELLPFMFPGEPDTGFDPESVKAALTEAVNAFESRGPGGFARALKGSEVTRHKHVFLFAEDGQLLRGDGTSPTRYKGVVATVLKSGHGRMQRYLGMHPTFVTPVVSATGRRYAAVVPIFDPGGRILRPRFWFNLAVAMVPAALVCMALTIYLTRPITRLRTTAQRLAGGDLSARSSPHRSRRRDELGDLARDFDAMAAQIESLMTAQRRFVADVSHELGAPLTRMHLALALLRRRLADKPSGELERIEREAGKLSSLVQQLLLLAGLEADARPAETLAPVSTGTLCDSIVEDANFEAEHAACRISGVRDDVTILAYPQMLRRAIDNVLRNAIRYAPRGSEILLNCRIDDLRQSLMLEIVDGGPGVPEPMLSDIFRPFFRTAPGREASSGGAGLGLAIAREAIRLHEGAITAHNRKSGGLEVSIMLPLRIPAMASEMHSAVAQI